MATEKETPSKAKRYRIQLKPSFTIPIYKGQPKTGVVYIRAGYTFSTAFGEGSSYHIISEAELEKFKLPKNQQFATSPLIYELDSNLVIEEVK